jgi:hypothetical protein
MGHGTLHTRFGAGLLRRWNRTVEVVDHGSLVPLDFRLPGDVEMCLGVQACVVGRFPTSGDQLSELGEFSLQLGGGQIHPLNQVVGYTHRSVLREEHLHRPDFLPMEVHLSPPMVVTGYYRDSGRLPSFTDDGRFHPYGFRLTFHLFAPAAA